ncbi:MAG: cytochrome P450 [Acidimicrobiia bacterium]|nr:cytochrome P450 [Acidimicrobiia bacterium]
MFAVSRDNAHWLNTNRSVLGPDADFEEMLSSGFPPPATLVHLDGEEHRKHRKVTNDWFKPAAVKKRQPRIDELADEFVQKMRDLGGSCDFAQDVAQPFTLRVIMDIYGVPEEDEPLMLELTQGIFGAADPEYLGDASDPQARVVSSVMRFIQYFNELTEDRRACPADDLATVIANGEVDNHLMEDDKRLWYYIIVATAGHDTTSFAALGAWRPCCATAPSSGCCRRTPSSSPTRRRSASAGPARSATSSATPPTTRRSAASTSRPVGGSCSSIPRRTVTPRFSPDPETFDVRRADADQLISFGVGAHFCLGAQFARRELRTMLGRLSRELDHIEPAGDPRWAESHFVSGVKHLPVEYAFR